MTESTGNLAGSVAVMVEPFGISPETSPSTLPTFFNVRDIMDNIRHACCFTGRRPKYFHFGTKEAHPDCLKIKAFVRERCEYLITQKGVTHFISGGAVGLDT